MDIQEESLDLKTLKELYYSFQNKYIEKIIQIKQRVKEGQKIRVGFFVVAVSTFGTLPLYKAMLEDELFETKIVMIPTVYNIKHPENIHLEAVKKFGEEQVALSYLGEGRFRVFDNDFDIAVFASPYDRIVPEIYGIEHFAKLGVLTIFTNYGFLISNHKLAFFTRGHEMSCLWRYYLDNKATYSEYLAHSLLKRKNAKFLGYPKMDGYVRLPAEAKGKKRIIITAHHSMQITKDALGIQFSCFLRYYDFYLRLAKMYPDVEFFFRPHPLWATILRTFWPEEMIREYLQKMKELPNMFFHNDSNYFDLFNSSHAMINDCGSFNVEYMFTGKPLCMLSKGEVRDDENYNKHFAQRCMKHHYKACSELDIRRFIEEVVLQENDVMKDERMEFFESEIKGNWPHSTEYILKDIKKSVLG